MNEKTRRIVNLIADLDFEYDRMSRKGQKNYDEICNLLGIEELPEESPKFLKGKV